MRKILIGLAILGWTLILTAGCGHTPSATLSAKEVKTLATGQVPESTSYAGGDPGESEPLPRGHAFAPPMIPHRIEGLEIRDGENPCLGCHADGMAGAPKVPDSHYQDLSTGERGAGIHMSRWSCTLCHAPQTDLKPLVENSSDQ